MMRILSILCSVLILLACNSPKAEKETGTFYGSEFEMVAEPLNLEALTSAMAEADSMEAQVVASIAGVCKKKGCWMRLGDAETGPMVTFKDYGFFVPMDCETQNARVQGMAYWKVVSVDELRHLAEDAGKSEDEIMAITEEERSLRLEATGVYLTPGAESM